jgi:hypothetical protein
VSAEDPSTHTVTWLPSSRPAAQPTGLTNSHQGIPSQTLQPCPLCMALKAQSRPGRACASASGPRNRPQLRSMRQPRCSILSPSLGRPHLCMPAHRRTARLHARGCLARSPPVSHASFGGRGRRRHGETYGSGGEDGSWVGGGWKPIELEIPRAAHEKRHEGRISAMLCLCWVLAFGVTSFSTFFISSSTR